RFISYYSRSCPDRRVRDPVEVEAVRRPAGVGATRRAILRASAGTTPPAGRRAWRQVQPAVLRCFLAECRRPYPYLTSHHQRFLNSPARFKERSKCLIFLFHSPDSRRNRRTCRPSPTTLPTRTPPATRIRRFSSATCSIKVWGPQERAIPCSWALAPR